MKSETVKIFTAIEVAECFMDAYITAYKANMEVHGNMEEVMYVTKDYECVKVMFDALKMTKLMQLPAQYKGEYSGYERIKNYFDDITNQYPKLLSDIQTAQQEAEKLKEQMNTVFYDNDYDMNKYSPAENVTTNKIIYGAVTFIKNISFIIEELEKNEKCKDDVLMLVKASL